MSTANWIQLAAVLGVVFAAAPLLGRYMARVFEGERHVLSFLGPLERGIYRLTGVSPGREMSWT
jgi:K+-transporting ATPase ATPase A chain